ncbi:MAG: cytochrome c biogenesis protein ResB [Verrucomicrobia bacterium]|nr:cytochrome c biogenesis protein ResB [Verrucomicrobiota bacterium]
MILLAVIIVACAVGTVAESRFDTAVAQAYVYDAPWFIGWLLLLCVNLICAVLLRYPWKPHHLGFIITHAGIVVLLVGAMIGRFWGVEGSVTLFKGAKPASSLLLNQTVFEAHASGLAERKSSILNLDVRPPSVRRPVQLNLKDIQISLVDYTKELGVLTRVEKAASNGSPAVRLVFRSDMAPQPISQWLVLGDAARDTILFGPAQIRFASGRRTDAAHAKTHFTAAAPMDSGSSPTAVESRNAAKSGVLPLPARDERGEDRGEGKSTKDGPPLPPSQGTEGEIQQSSAAPLLNAAAVASNQASESREKHFVFAKLPDMTMARVVSGQPTGIKAAFRYDSKLPENKERTGTLELKIDQQRFEFELAQILDRDVPLPGTAWTLNRVKFLPDFRLENKEPVSVSDTPNNPALVFEIAGASAPGEKASHDCDHEDEEECDHSQQKACCPKPGEQSPAPHGMAASSGVTILYGADQQLRFTSVSKDRKTEEGSIEIGKEISIGLADWMVRIDELIEHAAVRDEIAPLKEHGAQSINAPGVLVRVRRGAESLEQWVASGTPAHRSVGNEIIHFSFGRKVRPLDFSVALDDFEVERDEGSQSPAGFKSRVRFIDTKKNRSLPREIWMNHPADYPDFPGVSLLGTAYKFSQASWNPNDLSQTTLQVVQDPGWSLKWIGSLLVCGGIFTMFYVKPYPRRNATAS